MNVVVSACLIGENCKYNGKNNRNQAVIDFLKDKEWVAICPEQLSGVGTPRPRAEILHGTMVDEYGRDIQEQYAHGVELALSKIPADAGLAILRPRSPTCGVRQIYDGSFTGKLIDGMGLFAKALKARGWKVVDADVFELCPH